MEKYTKVLEKIMANKWNIRNLKSLTILEQYIKGLITPEDLLSNLNKSDYSLICNAINKVLNYECRKIRYYIELPTDFFFNTRYQPSIFVGKEEEIDIKCNEMSTIGPESVKKQLPAFRDNIFIEIKGDFTGIENGIELSKSDWFRIIERYPNLHDYIYFLIQNDYELNGFYENLSKEESYRRIDEIILEEKMKKASNLSEDFIDTIEFVETEKFITLKDMVEGKISCFEDLIKLKEKCSSEIINISLSDILDYYSNEFDEYLKMGINSDASYMTEQSLRGKKKHEKIIMLAYFLLNYKGNQAESHLYWFNLDKDVINSHICNIPLIYFAKLNNEYMVESFYNLGITAITKEEDKSIDEVKKVALLLGYKEKEISDTLSQEEKRLTLTSSVNHIDTILKNKGK